MPDESGEQYLRTEFLERIAHELRGPAGVTLGALDELELALNGESQRVGELLAMVRRSVQRVLRTADRLQRTAQLERGSVDWSREPCDFREVITAAAGHARSIEARKGIALEVNVPDTACIAQIDAQWVTTAITEVLVNAIRHAKKTATIDLAQNDGHVQLTVSDDGSGLAGSVAKRFTRPARRQGLGLSLSLVDDVVTAHGGELCIGHRGESPESGTRISLSFPCEPQVRS